MIVYVDNIEEPTRFNKQIQQGHWFKIDINFFFYIDATNTLENKNDTIYNRIKNHEIARNKLKMCKTSTLKTTKHY